VSMNVVAGVFGDRPLSLLAQVKVVLCAFLPAGPKGGRPDSCHQVEYQVERFQLDEPFVRSSFECRGHGFDGLRGPNVESSNFAVCNDFSLVLVDL
jgi:hypothetical protein